MAEDKVAGYFNEIHVFLYFFLLEAAFWNGLVMPALAHSHGQRSFLPCVDLCQVLLTRNPSVPQDALLRTIAAGLNFDRIFWHALIGECLVHGAQDIPRIQTAPEPLCCLLAPEQHSRPELPRACFAPIQQAHFGSRDLQFGGGFYRPDAAGLNDLDDVRRLAEYLSDIDPTTWKPEALAPLSDCPDDEQRAEELAYVRDWWPSLVELYQKARDRQWVVVCEKA